MKHGQSLWGYFNDLFWIAILPAALLALLAWGIWSLVMAL